MRKKEALISLAILAMGALVAGVVIYRPWERKSVDNPAGNNLDVRLSSLGKKIEKVSIPKNTLFQVVQASETRPKFVQAKIDPTDVHVGDVQKFEVILEDDEEIVSVQAKIETDHDVKTVDLKASGAAADAEMKPVAYYINDKHELAFVSDGAPKPYASKEGVAYADMKKVKYMGEWKVVDTHDTTYRTTFVAKDAKGRESSFTLTWSDYCSIPNAGDWYISNNGDCYLNAMDGPDNGTPYINAYTLYIQPSGRFVFNPGRTLSVNGGTIVIQDGGVIQKGYLWVYDGDGDNWISSSQIFSSSDPNNHP